MSSELVGLRNIATVALGIARAAASNPSSVGTHHLVPDQEPAWVDDADRAGAEVSIGARTTGVTMEDPAVPSGEARGEVGKGVTKGGALPSGVTQGGRKSPRRTLSSSNLVLAGL